MQSVAGMTIMPLGRGWRWLTGRSRYVLLCGILWLVALSTASGQSMGFLPEQRLSVSFEVFNEQFDSVLVDNTSRRSLLNELLLREGLSEEVVSGDLAYQSRRYQVALQYGLTPVFNLGIILPYLQRERRSSLAAVTTSPSAFIERNRSLKTEGIGDLTVQLTWRPLYSDNHDMQFGFALDGDNAGSNLGQTDSLPLGSGGKELKTLFSWRFYARASTLMGKLDVIGTIHETGDVKNEDNRTLRRSKGNDSAASLYFGANHRRFHFGGALGMASTASTRVDGVSQKDGYLGYELKGRIQYGNLTLLETAPVSRPWEIQLDLSATLFGNNKPATQTWALAVFRYF